MKNKFRIGEIVIINGIGKIYEKHIRALGIVKGKEYYFNEYLVSILSEDTEDWFSEDDLEIVMERRYKKQEKYKVALAIDMRGLDYITSKLDRLPNKNNNILKKIDIFKKYKAFKKEYAILIWTSTYWSETNFVVKTINESFKELRKMNIAYKQIIIGETDPTYIKINEFIDNDPNVDIFNIFQKIEIKNIGGILT